MKDVNFEKKHIFNQINVGKRKSRTEWGASAVISYGSNTHFRLRSPEVEIKVSEFGGEVKAILDTGATVRAVKKSNVQNKALEKSVITQVKFADGTTVRPLGEVGAEVEWKEEKSGMTFLVLEEMPYPIILGTDWIAAADAIVYYNNGKIRADKKGNKEFENFLRNRPVTGSDEEAFYVKQATVIPPGSAVLVAVICATQLNQPEKSLGRLVHRGYCGNPKRSWVIPNCLMMGTEGECVVPVINSGLRPVRFHPNEKIATSELVTEAVMSLASI